MQLKKNDAFKCVTRELTKIAHWVTQMWNDACKI